MTDQRDANFIDSDLLAAFIAETSEQIERLVTILLQIEADKERQSEFIDEMFRLAHNIKGSSGLIGLTEVTEVMHEIENLFSAVRNGQYALDNEAVDLLLSFTDEFSNYLTKNVMTTPFAGEKWLERIKSLTNKESSTRETNQKPVPPLILSEEEKAKVNAWQEEGKCVYEIDLKFSSDAQMRSVSAVIFLRYLRTLGNVLTTAPSEDLIPEENYASFRVVLFTEDQLTPEMEQSILNYPLNNGVQEINIRKWNYRNDDQKGIDPSAGDSLSAGQTIRVKAERIDNVINQLGKLLTIKTSLSHLYQSGYQGKPTWEQLAKILQELDQTVSTLQIGAMDLRMIPVRQLFSRFPKIVRDITKLLGKKVELHFVGEDTEIDKHIGEELIDALTHLLRNAVDHGLEDMETRKKLGKDPTGHITLGARQEGSHIVISVSDDGRGLDLEKIKEKAIATGLISEDNNLSDEEIIRLIFTPGFSTSSQVSEISGRGVGMDVVKTNLKRLQGDIDVQTEPGRGTTFLLRVPLTLAIIQSFMVKVGGQIFGIPVTDVVQSIIIKEEEIHTAGDQLIFYRYPETIPLVDLGEHFRFPFARDKMRIPVVIINSGRGHVGFIVEELIGLEDIMIKPINKAMGEVQQIAGAALLGSGQIGLILNHQLIAQQLLNID
ncbi:MAG TPA: chemotaxis protein CheA [Firmicutes bacterium]|uniref:Chemotaxis protein CheA n=1 Tax=Capillibacterium thermochitinicola TaxID=2699427 RepID=A0A8J6LMY1_9FIRM|nr:chemotaxis protein CheA [Capillibacterium thermochitinicola]MBA2133338.1 chemotaxis protein CheA [Capillibacterium thermochitinicola]HHW12236.1 chemotaxis protein CheA [Bacillota bacterium]